MFLASFATILALLVMTASGCGESVPADGTPDGIADSGGPDAVSTDPGDVAHDGPAPVDTFVRDTLPVEDTPADAAPDTQVADTSVADLGQPDAAPDTSDASQEPIRIGATGGFVPARLGGGLAVPAGATDRELLVAFDEGDEVEPDALEGDETPLGQPLRIVVTDPETGAGAVLVSPSAAEPLVVRLGVPASPPREAARRYALVMVPGLPPLPVFGRETDGALEVALLQVPGEIDVQLVESSAYRLVAAPARKAATADGPWPTQAFGVMALDGASDADAARARRLLEGAAARYAGWGFRQPWLVRLDGRYVAVLRSLPGGLAGVAEDSLTARAPLSVQVGLLGSDVTGMIYLNARGGDFLNEDGGRVASFPDSTPPHELFHAVVSGYGRLFCADVSAGDGWESDDSSCRREGTWAMRGYEEALAGVLGHVLAREVAHGGASVAPLRAEARHHKLDWTPAVGNGVESASLSARARDEVYGGGDFFLWLARRYADGSFAWAEALLDAFGGAGLTYDGLDALLVRELPASGGLGASHREFVFQRAYARSDGASVLRGVPLAGVAPELRDDQSASLNAFLFESAIPRLTPSASGAQTSFANVAPLTGRVVRVAPAAAADDVVLALVPTGLGARAWQGAGPGASFVAGELRFSTVGFDPAVETVVVLHNGWLDHTPPETIVSARSEACTPDCAGRECGDDGCGATCPPGCTGSDVCVAGQCESPECSGVDQRCEGDVLVYCESGAYAEINCAAEGQICAWSDIHEVYTCVPPPVCEPACPEGQVCSRGVCVPAGPAPGGYVLIPAGRFTMGSPSGEPGRDSDEGPQHEVVLTRSFYLKATEVTQGEWRSLMGTNPSYFASCGDDCPVEQVNWWEAVAYCNALSRAEGLAECYTLSGCETGVVPGEDMDCTGVTFAGLDCAGYRLPTEAEWEYAYRAGTTTALCNGGMTNTACSPLDANLDAIGWYCGNAGETNLVGQKQPNAWGLYDTSGNVWEWTWDRYGSYPAGTVTDPLGPDTGAARVGRGGSWSNAARDCRAALRGGYAPGGRGSGLGFRVARSIP